MSLFSGTLSCRQRDLHVRMFVIYKLCVVENEFEIKLNEPWLRKIILKWRICNQLEQITDFLFDIDCLSIYNSSVSTFLEDYSHLSLHFHSKRMYELAWFISCEPELEKRRAFIIFLLKDINLLKIFPCIWTLNHDIKNWLSFMKFFLGSSRQERRAKTSFRGIKVWTSLLLCSSFVCVVSFSFKFFLNVLKLIQFIDAIHILISAAIACAFSVLVNLNMVFSSTKLEN